MCSRVRCVYMGALYEYTDWKNVLRDYDEVVEMFSRAVLQSREHATHFDITDQNSKLNTELFGRSLAEGGKRSYPYVFPRIEGVEEAVEEAIEWFKSPPEKLREGLQSLVEGNTPANLLEIFDLYGEFRTRCGVLSVRNFNYAGYENQRTTGKTEFNKLRQYAASYMLAAMRKENADIIYGRYAFIEHVKDIVFGGASIGDMLTLEEFRKFLSHPAPLDPGQKERDRYDLHPKFYKELTTPKLAEWANEQLIYKLQHYPLQP